jgi:nucleoside-diphosphate-sugar epimerase
MYNPSAIVHLAAVTGIQRCLDAPSQAFNVNVYGSFEAVTAALESGSKFILASSREVYGETLNGVTREETPPLPNNLYGLTKMLSERQVFWAAKKHGLEYCILRLTNVYGPGGHNYGPQIIIRKVLNGEKILVFGGMQAMNFVHVNDVTRAIIAAIDKEKSIGEVFNVGSYDNLRVNELVQMIISLVGGNIDVEVAPYRDTETMFFKPDLKKIKDFLGWMPLIDFHTGLATTIDWYKRSVAELKIKA